MKKDKYIKKTLKANIKLADSKINELYKEYDGYLKLPDNCVGLEIDGFICENPNLKIDGLANCMHQIGYLECLRAKSKDFLELYEMDKKEFKKFLKMEKKIKKHNKRELKRVEKFIYKKKKNA